MRNNKKVTSTHHKVTNNECKVTSTEQQATRFTLEDSS